MTDRDIPPPGHEDVRQWLAAQGAEVAVPDSVARRLHQVLEREAAARSAESSAGTPADGSRPPLRAVDEAGRDFASGTSDAARAPARVSRWLVAASVAALAVLASVVVIPMLGAGEDDSTAQTTVIGPEVSDALPGDTAAGQAVPERSAPEAVPALPPVPLELVDALDDPAATPAPAGCGQQLAADQGADVLDAVLVRGLLPGAGADDTGVLVWTRGPSADAVWWLPTCSSGAADALARSAAG